MAQQLSVTQVPLMKPWFPDEMRRSILADINEIMLSGDLMLGKFASGLEQFYADLTKTTHGVSLSTATTGLQIALRYAEVAGGEVLVPAASFITDVSAVQMENATPVLVDIDPQTLTFDPAALEAKITERTKAIIWVHLVGLIGEAYEQIQDIAKRHGIFLIEDASHAHGASINGKPAGSLGDVGVFSFYPTKIMTCGTGGMLVTDDEQLASFARSLRLFGKDLSTGEIVHRGNDWFMDEFRACIGFHQAQFMQENLRRRHRAVQRYDEVLRNCNQVRRLTTSEQNYPGWYQYPVFANADINASAVRQAMSARGIACKQIYKPVHAEQLFAGLAGSRLHHAEEVLKQSLCLPLFAEITDEQIDTVAETLIDVINGELAS